MELGGICAFENGDRGSNYPSRAYRAQAGIPFINAGHLAEDGIDFAAMDYIPRERFDLLGGGKVRSGDVLFCLRGSLGKFASVGELDEGAIASSLVILRPSGRLSHEFLLAFLRSSLCEAAIKKYRNGAAQPNLSSGSLKKFLIPLPPLPEQRRIVAILDEAFEAIATARANAEKNLQNAGALFALQRDGLFSEWRQSWPAKLLGNVADVQSGGTPLVASKEFWGGSIAWYSSGELNDIATAEPERFITSAGLAASNAKLFPTGSLLVGMYDTAALKMSILDREAAFNQAIAGVKPNPNLEPEFVFHAINFDKPAILSLRRGVRQKNLSLGKIREIVVPVPSVAVQRQTIDRLHDAQERRDRLQGIYQRKLVALDELKKSLLHQAFTGQL